MILNLRYEKEWSVCKREKNWLQFNILFTKDDESIEGRCKGKTLENE